MTHHNSTSKVASARIPVVGRGKLWAFCLITSLFFLWGFARSVLDVLNKHFQDVLSISVARSTLVQGSTYVAYALAAIPAGMLIARRGYRRGIVTGLCLFGAGSLLFLPGAFTMRFGIFLAALFVIGCGLAVLETAANPYISELGPARTAASRLNLAQSFNGLGCILGPVTVGTFIFSSSGGSVAVPYTLLGILVICLAIFFSRTRLPDIRFSSGAQPDTDTSGKSLSFGAQARRLWRIGEFRFGLAALFCYEIAEIGINSIFINYAVATGWLDKMTATAVLSFGALGLFMLARVGGSALMRRVAPRFMLAWCGGACVAGALAVALCSGTAAHIGLFVCYLFEAIIFPTVFATVIARVGKLGKAASAFMMLTPLGGAAGTLAMGSLADSAGFAAAFFVPCAAYACVWIYALMQCRKNS